MKKAIYGICRKYVKTVVVDEETNEVEFVCKTHGCVNSYVVWQ